MQIAITTCLPQIGKVHFNLSQKKTHVHYGTQNGMICHAAILQAVSVFAAHCARATLVAKPDVDYAEFLCFYKKFCFPFAPSSSFPTPSLYFSLISL